MKLKLLTNGYKKNVLGKGICSVIMAAVLSLGLMSCTGLNFEGEEERAGLAESFVESAYGIDLTFVSEEKINNSCYKENFTCSDEKVKDKIISVKIVSTKDSSYTYHSNYLSILYETEEIDIYTPYLEKYFSEGKIITIKEKRYLPVISLINDDNSVNVEANTSLVLYEQLINILPEYENHELVQANKIAADDSVYIFVKENTYADNDAEKAELRNRDSMLAFFNELKEKHILISGKFCMAASSSTEDFSTITEKNVSASVKKFESVYKFNGLDNYKYSKE